MSTELWRGFRREVKVPARTVHKAGVGHLLLRSGFVEHEAYAETFSNGRLDLIEEGLDLDRSLRLRAAADDTASVDISYGEQIGRALAATISLFTGADLKFGIRKGRPTTFGASAEREFSI